VDAQGREAHAIPVLSREDEVRLVQQACTLGPSAKLRMILTPSGLADRWFLHAHDAAATSIVSLCDWAQISSLPAAAFVACELVLHGLYLTARCDPRPLMHEETRGCLFDFCGDKRAIDAKLRSGDICAACRAALTRHGVQVDAILGVLQVVRQLALGKQHAVS